MCVSDCDRLPRKFHAVPKALKCMSLVSLCCQLLCVRVEAPHGVVSPQCTNQVCHASGARTLPGYHCEIRTPIPDLPSSAQESRLSEMC